ncbi:MAG: ABC transporter ATP-binding protein [Bacteriovoracaceae bacterium]|jgi:ABC-2 type transport system ATP-binding protein|nr:ABC transporter ATP-binding protein [Bacteriovoracaceae bacterium]
MICLENVGKKFFKHHVLSKINLKLNSSDRIAIIGGNGAGKTTLFRCLLGHYTHQGNITIFGRNARRNRVELLKDVGFVPQIPPPIQMTVEELINFNLSISDTVTKDDIFSVASDLKLDILEHQKKPFFKFSGGMQQKLLIALALAKKPKLLVLDEPAANLDPYGREIFFERLQEIPKETIVLLTSHRVNEVKNFVNRVIEMDCGNVIGDQRFEVIK